ncbi:hypothetical protein [Methylobacterium sp. Leaf123]|uniref:hypothetical protein n=1 Tax=Methylobacterium sp. Leaf123 TaxID=1736264 RepID=UPI00138F18DB|nr:hypothetical protein [Methylobacterium sp. Leaf123]
MPAHIGQAEVEDDEVRALAPEQLQGSRGVRRFSTSAIMRSTKVEPAVRVKAAARARPPRQIQNQNGLWL